MTAVWWVLGIALALDVALVLARLRVAWVRTQRERRAQEFRAALAASQRDMSGHRTSFRWPS